MRLRLIYLIVLISAISCNKDPIDYEHVRTSYYNNPHEQSYDDSVITCVTFNIHMGFKAMDDPWNKDETGAGVEQIQNLVDILTRINPDIIALQEVPRNRYNAVVKDFLEQLAGKMNMNYAFGAHGYNDPYGIYPVYGEWGTAVLTKYKIRKIQNVEVEYVDKWQKRSMLDVTLEMNGSTAFHAMSVHYLPSDQGAPNTALHIKSVEGPVILMGDFNTTGEIPDFSEIGLMDTDSLYQKNLIDRIFYTIGNFSPVELGILPDTIGISDHAAIYSRLKINLLLPGFGANTTVIPMSRP